MFQTLQIGERKPIITAIKVSGEKSIFIAPQRNWPNGGQYPNTPLDIVIEVRFGFGGITNTDTFQLPTIGVYKTYSGDLLEAFAYYTPDQGLVTPYPMYNITAEVFRGVMRRTLVTVSKYFAKDDLPSPVTTVPYEIPAFSTEFRWTGKGEGIFSLSNYAATNLWSVIYNTNEIRNWTAIDPLAVQYAYLISGCDQLSSGVDMAVEFR